MHRGNPGAARHAQGEAHVSLTIRTCGPDDLPAVLDLMAQLGEAAHAQAAPAMETMQAVFKDMERLPDIYLNLVGIAEGQVVAFISVIFYKTLFHRGGTALINELIVDRAFRRAGFGQALVHRARQEALARGLDELEVGTETHNRPARQFYRKCGFDEEYVLLGMEFA